MVYTVKTKGSPAAVVEPVEEVEEPLRCQELGRAEVEVRVELVNDRLVADLGREGKGKEREGGVIVATKARDGGGVRGVLALSFCVIRARTWEV